jgi:DNA-binding CsgD family transcriptional regulator
MVKWSDCCAYPVVFVGGKQRISRLSIGTLICSGARMSEALVDLIYEAAFIPERWSATLDSMCVYSGSASGSLLVASGMEAPRYKTTALTQAALMAYTTSDEWQQAEAAPLLLSSPPSGFIYYDDLLSDEQLARDSIHRHMTVLGLGKQLMTVIVIPSGEGVVVTQERWLEDGLHDWATIRKLDALRPHLARAGLIAARLGLERARTMVSTLEVIGLPAAVLTRNGRVLAANTLLGQMPETIVPTAFSGVALANEAANALFGQAIDAVLLPGHGPVRSIPVPATAGHSPLIVHVLPLRGAAHDVFSGGASLMVVSAVGKPLPAPDIAMLHGLFDLTPAEAKIAGALCSGKSLKQIAAELNLQFSTARSYLERIFLKTGTNKQSELVALLRDTSLIVPA